MKTIEQPLFKSFVFAKVHDGQRTAVRLTEGVLNFVHHNGRPLLLKRKNIQDIRRFQQLYSSIEVIDLSTQTENNPNKNTAIRNGCASLHVGPLNLVLLAHATHPARFEATTDNI